MKILQRVIFQEYLNRLRKTDTLQCYGSDIGFEQSKCATHIISEILIGRPIVIFTRVFGCDLGIDMMTQIRVWNDYEKLSFKEIADRLETKYGNQIKRN